MLLEEEGFLSNLIMSKFAENKFLFEDLSENNLFTEFKDYIYRFINQKKSIAEKEHVSPFILMKKAGYTLYKCENDSEVKSFKKYWDENEALCTFIDKERVNENLVFFAVKDNVDKIKREDFKYPLRQDEYGTSVISIQFSKGFAKTLSIKNRYNHSVANPDATFSNDLDNIVAGLTESFIKEFNLNLVSGTDGLEIPGYVLANNGKLYKYNYEVNNKYFCVDNVMIDGQRNVTQFDKNSYIIMDNFVLDMQTKKIVVMQSNHAFYSEFIKGNMNNDKAMKKIVLEKNGTDRVLTMFDHQNGKMVVTVDAKGRIVEFASNAKKVYDDFLSINTVLRKIDLPYIEEVGKRFLSQNLNLQKLSVPNLKFADFGFLSANKELDEIDVANLEVEKGNFLSSNNKLKHLNVPKLKHMGNAFLTNNKVLESINIDSVEVLSSGFLENCTEIKIFYAPKVKEVLDSVLINATNLINVDVPLAECLGFMFMSNNTICKNFNMPNVRSFSYGALLNHPEKRNIVSSLREHGMGQGHKL